MNLKAVRRQRAKDQPTLTSQKTSKNHRQLMALRPRLHQLQESCAPATMASTTHRHSILCFAMRIRQALDPSLITGVTQQLIMSMFLRCSVMRSSTEPLRMASLQSLQKKLSWSSRRKTALLWTIRIKCLMQAQRCSQKSRSLSQRSPSRLVGPLKSPTQSCMGPKKSQLKATRFRRGSTR